MNKGLKQILLNVGLLSGVAVLAATPIGMAHGGSDAGDDSHRGRSSSQVTIANEVNTTSSDASDDEDSLHSRAESFLQNKRQNGKKHSKHQRQTACEARQKGILKRTNAFATAAERHLTKLDSIFTKVQAFQADKQLNVADYDTLVAVAANRQAVAQARVDALKALDIQIDCTQDDPAATVASIKTAVSDAKKALKEYRSAVKDVVVALKNAVPADDSTEGGDQ